VGGYDLIVMERGKGGYGAYVGDAFSVVGEDGELVKDACMASGWYDQLTELATSFIDATGIAMLEIDGPYDGTPCACEDHDYHHDLTDSVYRQTQLQNQFIMEMRNRDVFVNQPDMYVASERGRENEKEERSDEYRCYASSLRSSHFAQCAVIVLTSNSLHQQQQVLLRWSQQD